MSEALRGQLARSATASAAGTGSTEQALARAELLKSLEQLVEQAVAKKAAEGALATAAGEPDPIVTTVATSLEIPGAPNLACALMVRSATGPPGGAPLHDAIFCDPAVPRAAWVTRCGWHFASSPHTLLTTGEITCGRCIGRRAVDARKLL